MKISIAIKALNEQEKIAKALESAINAARPLGGEVVLADSGSDDNTVGIAKGYPVEIYQLANAKDRSCGAGAQMAFQVARGDYFYLMDGDMILNKDFVLSAVDYLSNHPDVAGVGGIVEERNFENAEFRIRAQKRAADTHLASGLVDRLDGGGLYRSAAVRDVGYFADRNLHAFEEFELASRLHEKGWKLVRLNHHSVDHFSHQIGGYRLLWRRILSGNFLAAGELWRSTLFTSRMKFVVSKINHIAYGVIVYCWWIAMLGLLTLDPLSSTKKTVAFVIIMLGPIIFLSVRRKSLELGLYSFLSWNIGAVGFALGAMRRRVSARQPLAVNRILSQPDHNPIRD